MKQSYSDINKKFNTNNYRTFKNPKIAPFVKYSLDFTESGIDFFDFFDFDINFTQFGSTAKMKFNNNYKFLINNNISLDTLNANLINDLDNTIEEFIVPVKLDPTKNLVKFQLDITNVEIVDQYLIKYSDEEVSFANEYHIYYSNFNDILLYPLKQIKTLNDINNFAFDLQKVEYDSTEIAYDDVINLNMYAPDIFPALNNNFKFKLLIDYSLIGAKPTNGYRSSSVNHMINKTTDITQNIIDCYYDNISASTFSNVRSFLIYDCNISNYDDTSFDLNYNIDIIQSTKNITRTFMPAQSSLNFQTYYSYSGPDGYIGTDHPSQKYCYTFNTIVSFAHGLRYINRNQEHFAHFPYTTGMLYINNPQVDNTSITKLTKNSFPIEFSGELEIIDLTK